MTDVETQLAAARTRLILEKPFLGALVLRLPMKAAGDWCQTTATDARNFYYNPAYIAALNLAQTQFMLAHEALHCALSHFNRRRHRVKWRWDLACDFAINPLLVAEGLTPPPDCLVLNDYAGMTAEEIYPLLDQYDADDKPLDEHLYDDERPSGGQGERTGDGQSGAALTPPEPRPLDADSPADDSPRAGATGDGAQRPPPLEHEERERLQTQWSQRMAGAAQQAQAAGKLSGALARLVDHLLQPQLPWRMLLARYLTATARNDYHYQRPSRREGDAILPSLRSQQVNIVVALDTSGSIGAAEMDRFVTEIDAIKGQAQARITLLACDAALNPHGPWEYEPWDTLRLPERLGGGGGTDFCPVFAWAEGQTPQPDALVYFTDAEGRYPEREPAYPVIWLVKGRGQTPWGQRIQLNA